jgi:hypothetical protein
VGMLCPYENYGNNILPEIFRKNAVMMVKRLVTGNRSRKGALYRSSKYRTKNQK